MKLVSIEEELKGNTYPGRGIIIGKSADGKYAVAAYFIMGRSVNSRNRIFVPTADGIKTEAFDPAKLEDPSLVIYAPVRQYKNHTIVTNGDQTDTIYQFLEEGKTFADALHTREFEPDAPNFTPRISGMITLKNGGFSYVLSILKSSGGRDASCERFFYAYDAPLAGEGRFIHTYRCDGNPIPSYEGEPTPVIIDQDIDTLTQAIWNALDTDNKVSLYVSYLPLDGGKPETRIVNKNC
ncbi:MAG TPA: IMP cyclohydrolase [Firmicutes bacterium]|nr:IMP cyclohydrolase [Bacillota bacterium]